MKTNNLEIMEDAAPGIGKKILSFFVREDETPAKAAPTPPQSQPEPQVKPATQVTNAAGTMQVDRKFVEHFVALLERANLPGPDYFEYKQALQNMDGLGLPEDKQYQAAWASFKAMGGVKDTEILKTSAEQYLAVLEKDRTSFLADVEKAIKARVGSLQEEHKRLEENNISIARQMEELQKKVDENKARLGQIAGEVNEQSAKIHANREGFETAHTSFVEQIKLDLTNINQHLK